MISNKIKEYVSYNPTDNTTQLAIGELCQRIEDNQIVIPLFQRELSWTLKKQAALLNYQMFSKAAISPISFTELNSDESLQVSFINREVVEPEITMNSVIDGQQRLSTNYLAYSGDESLKGIVLDLTKGKIRISESADNKKNLIPVTTLFNRDLNVLNDFLQKSNFKDKETEYLIFGLRSKFMSYKYTINKALRLSELEQIEWFEVLNNAGTTISSLQMDISKLKLKNFDFYKKYTRPYNKIIKNYGYDNLFTKFSTKISYPVASLNPAYEVLKKQQHKNNYAPFPSDSKGKNIIKLSEKELGIITEKSLESLKWTMDFIKENNLKSYITKMDYILYVSGYYTFNGASELDKLVTWIKTVDFSDKSNTTRRNLFSSLVYREFQIDFLKGSDANIID
ncbi:DUF262 domain-containing protein [Holzapfeliella sp. JNUCC 72]